MVFIRRTRRKKERCFLLRASFFGCAQPSERAIESAVTDLRNRVVVVVDGEEEEEEEARWLYCGAAPAAAPAAAVVRFAAPRLCVLFRPASTLN